MTNNTAAIEALNEIIETIRKALEGKS